MYLRLKLKLKLKAKYQFKNLVHADKNLANGAMKRAVKELK